jgi:hypothetical protein
MNVPKSLGDQWEIPIVIKAFLCEPKNWPGPFPKLPEFTVMDMRA